MWIVNPAVGVISTAVHVNSISCCKYIYYFCVWIVDQAVGIVTSDVHVITINVPVVYMARDVRVL